MDAEQRTRVIRIHNNITRALKRIGLPIEPMHAPSDTHWKIRSYSMPDRVPDRFWEVVEPGEDRKRACADTYTITGYLTFEQACDHVRSAIDGTPTRYTYANI